LEPFQYWSWTLWLATGAQKVIWVPTVPAAEAGSARAVAGAKIPRNRAAMTPRSRSLRRWPAVAPGRAVVVAVLVAVLVLMVVVLSGEPASPAVEEDSAAHRLRTA
jgi:hypothetical protein